MKKALLLLALAVSVFSCAFQENAAQPVKPVPAIPVEKFDALYSDKDLGLTIENGRFVFRLFAPRANQVELAFFRAAKGPAYQTCFMTRDDNGVWEYSTKKRLWGKYYGYYISAENGKGDVFNRNVLIPDPYSKVVSTQNNAQINARTYIQKDGFDWAGDTWLKPQDPRDLIIYETHVRDLTAHPSSGVKDPGTYLGMIEKITYLKNLGVNAVEFLPLHDFANFEKSDCDSAAITFNTRNPYGRNHWGYMSTFFFSPENYYGSNGSMQKDAYIDDKGKSVEELKTLIKALHNAGIAVIMDVAYTHTSAEGPNPFKMTDKKYYYRPDEDQDFLSLSGCGNDFKTERAMARKMIVESVLFWMKEYHVDGFRFDRAAMIDDGTLDEVLREARMINPAVIMIADPRGAGKYDPGRFSELGWASWNHEFQNGLKGRDPYAHRGFIFGEWPEGISRSNVMRFLMGSPQKDGGKYPDARHSVNFLETHEEETFGDFIRFCLGKAEKDRLIEDLQAHHFLTPEELRYHKLGAFILGTSQGIAMIHAGQEFGRSKVIEQNNVPDPRQGMIDDYSYNKDNTTNYINYKVADRNRELINFYASIFRLRQVYPQLRKAAYHTLEPFYADSEFGIGYRILPQNDKEEDLLILINGSKDKPAFYNLPAGMWSYLFSTHPNENKRVLNYITLAPSAGVILKK